ncbi:glycosyltransferase family 4 protein [Roseateles saccharophilus]|uniref:Glycosyltransferase involved in cell wall biosynthesis n=1 Tax=Roseateles saccharophilus TaxID=304 RepID=A0A4R3UAU6_ROSSA|nr:glycosyltransferase family 4 protein [Roseateles saccharophilus]MDG0835816.1 glycosyltransferase WbuB [Roseateles saccharophilus]TCU83634.1 glycosyltransferase involved in cell wall biosynthesis [Roseateles saccharophilus]
MRILLVNHYAGSPRHGMEFRPYYLAREWVRAGHEVMIVAASQSHVRAVQPEVGGEPREEVIDGIRYRWLPTPTYQGNGVGRLRNILSFLRQLRADALRLTREFKPDAVIASSTYPMDVWVARKLARLAKAKLVYEVHDLWPLSLIELSGMSPRHPFAMLCGKAEADAYRDADVVVSMLPCVHEHMASRGLGLKKLHIVPNGFAPEEWQGETAPLGATLAAHLDAEHAAGRVVVGYAGSMGLPNALDVLLDAAARLKEAPLSFVLVGSGHEALRLTQRAQAEGLTNVRFFAPIPKAQIPTLLARFDIAYIGWQRTPIYRFGIAPNKLIDYLMAGRAVLHSVEAGNDPVAEAGAGLTVAPEDPQAVADGLQKLAALTPAQRAEMGQRGREFAMAHHAYPVLAARFIQALA